MELVKLIPQAFFDFFARLVPGALALAIFLANPYGQNQWRMLLESFAAGKLDKSNLATLAVSAAIMTAYVVGQLAAPFGKAMQRVAETIATFPKAIIYLRKHGLDGKRYGTGRCYKPRR